MTLVENLQEYLTRLRDRPGLFSPPSRKELEHLRLHLRARFEELQLIYANKPQSLRLAHVFPTWLARVEDLASEVCWSIDALGIREDERLEALCLGIDLDLPEETPFLTFAPTPAKIWHNYLGRIVKSFQKTPKNALSWKLRRRLIRYASELRLTRQADDIFEVAPMGEVLLRLTGRDAIRWLLAVEVTQSLGSDDPWRMSREDAANLANEDPIWADSDEVPYSKDTLARCRRLMLMRLVYEDPPNDAVAFYEVTPLGRELLKEVGSQDTPFTLLAQALSADQTQAILAPLGNSSPNAAAEATVRHTRLVAHEIRNALVPVRVAMKQLWRDLDQAGQEAVTREPRQAIDGNIERIFRFLDESIHLSRLASTPPEIFDLLPAIRDAIIGLDQPPRRSIEPQIEPGTSAVRVRGHRQRLVLALVNLLRNAVQAGGPNVSIGIQVAALPEQKRIQIVLDDDGPGIPTEQRDAIFQNGVSHRSDGTGHGLTLVREVIEREMSGKIACENGQRGGARFTIELPWA